MNRILAVRRTIGDGTFERYNWWASAFIVASRFSRV
jgi:hypothetical protein